MERGGKVLKSCPRRTKPISNCRGSPLGGSVRVAVIARIACSKLGRQIRSRDAEAVIASTIDHHKSADRHVARNASGCWVHTLMVMVGNIFVVYCMALQADLIT